MQHRLGRQRWSISFGLDAEPPCRTNLFAAVDCLLRPAEPRIWMATQARLHRPPPRLPTNHPSPEHNTGCCAHENIGRRWLCWEPGTPRHRTSRLRKEPRTTGSIPCRAPAIFRGQPAWGLKKGQRAELSPLPVLQVWQMDWLIDRSCLPVCVT